MSLPKTLTASRVLLGCVLLSFGLTACRQPAAPVNKAANRIVISKTAGPRTFNRLMAADEQTNSINDCMIGRLIHINRVTQQPEAELATAWQASPDGKSLTVDLRRDVKFSDGKPFTAEDVLFTFQVINDPEVESAAADLFDFNGKRMSVEKLDDYKVRFVFPEPFAAAERLFDGVAILPRHVLETTYREKKFAEAWTLATPPEQIVGLGPFKLKEYVAGQRVVLTRNEHYWKKDAAGQRLPYLDELVFALDPDRSTQLLKFQNGETDLLSPVNADDVAALMPHAQQGHLNVTDLGPGLIREIFWFNQSDAKSAKLDPVKRAWFSDVRFRQAVSHALDREAIVRLAFAGKAAAQSSFLSAGDKLWNNPNVKTYSYDLARAKALLTEAGFRWPSETQLQDARGNAVEFTLLTNAGNVLRQKMSALIQADLAKLGIKVNVATLESRALLAKINDTRDYEACLLAVVAGDADPSTHVNILSSQGLSHWWNLNQSKPATPWEARLDELMQQQQRTLDANARKQLFDEAQSIMAEQQPFIFLAARHLIVASKTDIGNLRPALLPDFVLWNCEELKRQ